jgi:hypothetical protein
MVMSKIGIIVYILIVKVETGMFDLSLVEMHRGRGAHAASLWFVTNHQCRQSHLMAEAKPVPCLGEQGFYESGPKRILGYRRIILFSLFLATPLRHP